MPTVLPPKRKRIATAWLLAILAFLLIILLAVSGTGTPRHQNASQRSMATRLDNTPLQVVVLNDPNTQPPIRQQGSEPLDAVRQMFISLAGADREGFLNSIAEDPDNQRLAAIQFDLVQAYSGLCAAITQTYGDSGLKSVGLTPKLFLTPDQLQPKLVLINLYNKVSFNSDNRATVMIPLEKKTITLSKKADGWGIDLIEQERSDRGGNLSNRMARMMIESRAMADTIPEVGVNGIQPSELKHRILARRTANTFALLQAGKNQPDLEVAMAKWFDTFTGVPIAPYKNLDQVPTGPAYLIDSGLRTWGTPTFWVDQQRVLAVGFTDPIPDAPEKMDGIDRRLRIWTIGQGVDVLVNKTVRTFNYADGELYAKLRDDKAFLKGPIDQLKIEMGPPSQSVEGRRFNPMDNTYEPTTPKKRSRYYLTLRTRDGYLDLGPRTPGGFNPTGLVRLVTPGRKPIALPIPAEKLDFEVEWIEWANRYFVRQRLHGPGRLETNMYIQQWRSNGQLDGWLFDEHGHIDRVGIPYGPWSQLSNIWFIPVHDGMLINIHRYDPQTKTTTYPLYYATDKGHMLLLDGAVRSASVCPRGRKIAFLHSWESAAYPLRGRLEQRLKMIDLDQVAPSLLQPFTTTQ